MRLIIINEATGRGHERMEVATRDQRQIHGVSVQSRRSPGDVNFQYTYDIYVHYTLHATIPLVIHAIPPDLRSAIQTNLPSFQRNWTVLTIYGVFWSKMLRAFQKKENMENINR